MKKKTKFWSGLIGAFILGALFSFGIAYIFFTQIPQGTILRTLADIVLWTLGLPFLLALWISSSEWMRQLLCSPYGQSTFGCWAGNSFRLSILIYGALFALIYYYFFRLRKK